VIQMPASSLNGHNGEWHINLQILPTTWSFCPISFAMILIYKDFKTLKITGFGALAGQIQHMAAQKVGFMLRPIRYYRPPNLRASSSAALKSYIAELSWKPAS